MQVVRNGSRGRSLEFRDPDGSFEIDQQPGIGTWAPGMGIAPGDGLGPVVERVARPNRVEPAGTRRARPLADDQRGKVRQVPLLAAGGEGVEQLAMDRPGRQEGARPARPAPNRSRVRRIRIASRKTGQARSRSSAKGVMASESGGRAGQDGLQAGDDIGLRPRPDPGNVDPEARNCPALEMTGFDLLDLVSLICQTMQRSRPRLDHRRTRSPTPRAACKVRPCDPDRGNESTWKGPRRSTERGGSTKNPWNSRPGF